jgi:hypothetical protein
MKNLIYILLFFPMFMIGQSSGNTNSQKESVTASEKKMKLDKTAGFIWNNFNKPEINAYQNRALDKLNEFYNYLILLQSADNSELQNQLKLNIKELFFGDTASFQNIIDSQNKKYSIDEILTQVIDKKIAFTMPVINQNAYLNHNDFEFSYTVKVVVNNEVKQLNLTQKVYLHLNEKTFGTVKKMVWELKLGEF